MYIITQISNDGSDDLKVKCLGPVSRMFVEDDQDPYDVGDVLDLYTPIMDIAKAIVNEKLDTSNWDVDYLAMSRNVNPNEEFYKYADQNVQIFATHMVTEDHIAKKLYHYLSYILPHDPDELNGEVGIYGQDSYMELQNEVARFTLYAYEQEYDTSSGEWKQFIFTVSEF